MTRKNLQVELINEAPASQFDPAIAEVLSLGQGSADVLAERKYRGTASA